MHFKIAVNPLSSVNWLINLRSISSECATKAVTFYLWRRSRSESSKSNCEWFLWFYPLYKIITIMFIHLGIWRRLESQRLSSETWNIGMNNVQTSAVHKQLHFKSGWLTRMMWPNGGKNIPIASFETPFRCSLWYNETNEFKVAIDKVDVGWTYRFYLQRFRIEQWFQSRQKFAIQNAKSFKVSKFFKCNDWINIHKYIWNVFLVK